MLLDLDDVLLSRILQHVARPLSLLLTCRRIQGVAYALHGGPLDSLARYGFPAADKCWPLPPLPAWPHVQHLFDYLERRLLDHDVAFVRRCCEVNSDLINVAVNLGAAGWRYSNAEGWPKRSGVLDVLVQAGDLEMFALLLRSCQVRALRADGWWGITAINQQTGTPYPYFRECLLHNLRHGCSLERSGCTACRRAPVWHRGWTLRALIREDDLELLQLYLAQRLPDRIGAPQPYTLLEDCLLQIWIGGARKIAACWAATGRAAALSRAARERLVRTVPIDALRLSVNNGVDLCSARFLRLALRRFDAVQSASVLINAYAEWPLSRQERQHLRHRIGQWTDQERALIKTSWLYSSSMVAGGLEVRS